MRILLERWNIARKKMREGWRAADQARGRLARAQRRRRWEVLEHILANARPAGVGTSHPSVTLRLPDPSAAGPAAAAAAAAETVFEQLRTQLGEAARRLGGDHWYSVRLARSLALALALALSTTGTG